ncbi:MAG TPA: DUF4097 family beta strand repeat-containing protein [Pyrinomonadaceae bacterium]|nr:DUF4097 family beta strand repeat-containing protein [Pyrinomonadaceae bacterium]
MKRAISLSILAAGASLALLAQVAGANDHVASHATAHAHAGATQPIVAAAQTEQKEFRWHGPVAAGREIEIKGVNGNVEAEASSGSEVEVVAVKRARRSDPDDVRIEVVQHSEGVTICAVYPNVEERKPNTCAPGEGGHMSVRDNDTSVNFRVRVPAGVRFAGRTVNGKVEADNLTADVEATTVNGGINISTSGLARAKTVNGSIRALMGRSDWSNGLVFTTVNGGIELSFPAGLNTEVDAKTLNGEITSDFPLTVTGRFSKRRMTGTIGGGGRELRLETVNGSVQIRRAS